MKIKINEFILNHPLIIHGFAEFIEKNDIIDIKYSCCCDSTGKKVTTCALVLYRDKK